MTMLYQDKLKILANDAFMLEAVINLMSEKIEEYKPQVEKMDSDELLGQRFRAYEKSKEILKSVMENINALKDNLETKQTINKGL